MPSTPHPSTAGPLSIKAGERWLMPATQRPWRLRRGVLRSLAADGSDAIGTGLLLPGDLIGFEALLSPPRASAALAWRDCELHAVKQGTPSDWLAESLAQQLRRQQQLMSWRQGPVPARVEALLAVLCPDAVADTTPLPTLREMATLLDTTFESVSRALGALRRRQHRPLRTRWAPVHDEWLSFGTTLRAA